MRYCLDGVLHFLEVSGQRIGNHLRIFGEAEAAAKGIAELVGVVLRKSQFLQDFVEAFLCERPVNRKCVDFLLMAFLHFCVCVHRSMASFAFSLTVIGVVW